MKFNLRLILTVLKLASSAFATGFQESGNKLPQMAAADTSQHFLPDNQIYAREAGQEDSAIQLNSRAMAPHTNELQHSIQDELHRGDVFGLVTLSENKDVNGETVVIYDDGTLGIKDPISPGYLFEGVLFNEYNLLVVPEPFATVKLNDQNVFFVNDSLYNPETSFSVNGWTLKVSDGSTVVCPSWNSVLVYVAANSEAQCDDAIGVNLGIVPITLD